MNQMFQHMGHEHEIIGSADLSWEATFKVSQVHTEAVWPGGLLFTRTYCQPRNLPSPALQNPCIVACTAPAVECSAALRGYQVQEGKVASIAISLAIIPTASHWQHRSGIGPICSQPTHSWMVGRGLHDCTSVSQRR